MSSSRPRSGKPTPRPRLRALVWLVPALLALFISKPAAAYPWMIKHGYSACSTCHADPSGGELLTVYGRVISDAFLSMKWKDEESSSRASRPRVAGAPRLRLAQPVAAYTKIAPPLPSLPLLVPFAQAAPPEQDAAPAPSDVEPPSDAPPVEGTPPADALPADDAAPADDTAAPSEPPVPPAAPEPPPPAETPAPEPAPSPEVLEPAPELPPEESESSDTGLPFYEPFFGLFPLPERLLLGGSIRLASTYKPEADDDQFKFFPMQLDLYGELAIAGGFGLGGSLGASKVPAGSPHARAAQITSDQGDGYNLISRTHYLRFDFDEGSSTIRAGRLNVPFGLRMSEHVMWIREQTQTDRESDQQSGAALAMSFDKVRFEVMGIAGNYQIAPDDYRERGYSGYVELAAWNKAAFGVSSLLTVAGDDRLNPVHEDTTRQAHGVFGRVTLDELAVLMFEADVLLRSRRDAGYVGFAQLDVEPIRGLHFIATGEVLDSGYPDDADAKAPGAGEPKFGGWISAQWFFASHFDLRVDGIVRKEEPFQLLGQLHVYL